MAGNTALSYQMMIEETLLHAMVHSEQTGNIAFACQYASAELRFLGIEKDDLPKLPMLLKTESEKQIAYVTQYFNLLDKITTTTSKKIAQVRKDYNKKGNSDLLK